MIRAPSVDDKVRPAQIDSSAVSDEMVDK
jgi:hypothetical protein